MTRIYNNTPIFFNIPKLQFKGIQKTFAPTVIPNGDSFSSNPLYDNFGSQAEIEAAAKSNPRIQEILKKYRIPLKVNMEELASLKKGHLMDTRVMVTKMYSALPKELKDEVNLKALQEAAMFHDYGKVLIPEKVLNKTSELTDEEREIMNLHSEFGYELLKNKNLSKEALRLIKYHHQTPDGNGYPAIENDYENSLAAQILSVADKYTALREDRCYKDAMTKEEALEILSNDNISEEVLSALKACA